MDEQQLLSMLQSFVLQKSSAQAKPWMSYGGINNNAPVTLIQQIQGQIQSLMTGMLGPLGGLAAPYVSQFITGTDFNRNGTLNNSLSGLLAPSAGTYANAWQKMRSTQQLTMLKGSREALEKDLRRDFYRNYYSMTMGRPVGDKTVGDEAERAMQNLVSVPAALQFLFDPAKNQRIMQGVKNTQAGFLYWQDRLNASQVGPNSKDFNYINFDGRKIDRIEAAKLIGESVSGMAKQANQWQLGATQGTYKDSFGGFTGAQVSQLASILANSTNTFDPGDLRQSIKQFQDKIKATAQALAPLKDIFGKDIKAMTDMLQSMSGQNIDQLSPTMISSMAKSTVDMARYSGASVTQIAQAGQKLFMQTSQLGGNTFSRIGGGMTGAYYTGLIAQGNAPAGVHAAQYAGSSQRALASAQASSGVDWTAMAYGMWQQKQQAAGKDSSIDTFMKNVRQARRRGRGRTMMDAVIEVAGAGSQQGLLRGLNTLGYRTSLQGGRLAQLGIEAQYYTQLGDAIGALKVANTGISEDQWNKLGTYLANDKNAAAIKQLTTSSNRAQAVKKFAAQAGVSQAAVNRFINTGNMQQYMARWASSIQINNYKQSQEEIRAATQQLDAKGASGLMALWQAASDPTKFDTKTGTLNIGKNKEGQSVSVGKFALQAQMRALFGDSNTENLPKRIEQLGKLLGGRQKAIQVLALAGGQFGSDDQFSASIRTLSDPKASQDAKDAAKGYIMARRNGFLGQNTKFTSKEAIAARDLAYKKYQKAAKGTQKQKDDAKDALRSDLDKALRIQNLSKMTGAQLGVQGTDAIQKRRGALIKYLKDRGTKGVEELLKTKNDDAYKSAVKNTSLQGISKADLQRAYSSSSINYSNVDTNRIMVTLLQQLLEWLRNNHKQKK